MNRFMQDLIGEGVPSLRRKRKKATTRKYAAWRALHLSRMELFERQAEALGKIEQIWSINPQPSVMNILECEKKSSNVQPDVHRLNPYDAFDGQFYYRKRKK